MYISDKTDDTGMAMAPAEAPPEAPKKKPDKAPKPADDYCKVCGMVYRFGKCPNMGCPSNEKK